MNLPKGKYAIRTIAQNVNIFVFDNNVIFSDGVIIHICILNKKLNYSLQKIRNQQIIILFD